MTYFFLFLDMDEGGSWGRRAQASLRGRPRGRLSGWAGLSVDAGPTLLEGGEGPWSEGSTVLSSEDILEHKGDVRLTKGGVVTVDWPLLASWCAFRDNKAYL